MSLSITFSIPKSEKYIYDWLVEQDNISLTIRDAVRAHMQPTVSLADIYNAILELQNSGVRVHDQAEPVVDRTEDGKEAVSMEVIEQLEAKHGHKLKRLGKNKR